MTENAQPNIIDIDVQDPRIMRKCILDKYVILNYNASLSGEDVSSNDNVSPELRQMRSEERTTDLEDSLEMINHRKRMRYSQRNDVRSFVGELIYNREHYFSIIIDKETTQPLSIAPSLPIPLDVFIQKYPIGTEHIQINQMDEGTLIQLFYDTSNRDWQIATKGSIGGNNRHYRTEYPGYTFRKQKTFREMFYDALTQVSVGPQIIPDSNPDKSVVCDLTYKANDTYYNTPLRNIPYIKTLDKSHCYSYIITHPSNPIVNNYYIPKITLVAVCKILPITQHGNGSKYIAQHIPQKTFAEMIPAEYRKIVRIQPSIDWLGKSLYEETINFVFSNDIHPGIMITNIETGERAVLENISYAYAAQLRGNHTNLQYQFFELHCSNRLGEFLTRFPSFTGLFMHFFNQYYDFTFRVYSVYVQYYIHKNRDFVNYVYHKHASKIHREIYIANGTKIPITRELVQHYFNRMTPSQLLYFVTRAFVITPL